MTHAMTMRSLETVSVCADVDHFEAPALMGRCANP
jgi:hypothetical protein